MEPVVPTSSAHASVSMPMALCQSSQTMRRFFASRTRPSPTLRKNGKYTTTPDTIAARNTTPIAPRKSLPNSPANMSTCSFSSTNFSDPLPGGMPSGCAVRASTVVLSVSSGGVSARGAVTTTSSSGSSDSQIMYCGT